MHDAGRKVSLTLSDGFCVDRHRQTFLELVEGEVDILFANEVEIMSLYEVDTFDEAFQHVRGHCEVAALTERGSVVVANDEVHLIDANPVAQLVDTTGAVLDTRRASISCAAASSARWPRPRSSPTSVRGRLSALHSSLALASRMPRSAETGATAAGSRAEFGAVN